MTDNTCFIEIAQIISRTGSNLKLEGGDKTLKCLVRLSVESYLRGFDKGITTIDPSVTVSKSILQAEGEKFWDGVYSVFEELEKQIKEKNMGKDMIEMLKNELKKRRETND